MLGSTCFGHYYAHHQELTTIVLITTWAVSGLQAIACTPETYPACLHLTSNQQQPKNRAVHVVISTISRELLMVGIVVPETC